MSDAGENPFKKMMRKSPSPVGQPPSASPSTQQATRAATPLPETPGVSGNLKASFERAPRSPAGSPPVSRKSSINMVKTPLTAGRLPSNAGQTPKGDADLEQTMRSMAESISAVSNPGAADAAPARSVVSGSTAGDEHRTSTPVGDDTTSQSPGVTFDEPQADPAPVSVALSPEDRLVELESLLATRERELHLSREQVNSLQRLAANSSHDAKIKMLSDERAKLAARVKEVETKLTKEVEKWKKEAKAREKEVAELKSREKDRRSREQVESRKSMSRAEAEALAVSQVAIQELNTKHSAMQKAMAEKDAEVVSLQKQLKRAHDAIEHGATVGYNNEVKLHQARSALHAIMSEVSLAASPARERQPQTPSSDSPMPQVQQVPQHLQQVHHGHSPTPHASAASPPRYVFNYSLRGESASPHHR
eukprot:TRINITY_DN37444_c0_g1_i1.p1 TRINITY_DN37444_c0_g1~~TRINITY_DN37444_c0_g1_i1.p1  ORF type:complete len:421 (+),score=157.10 TRINITY_DN37444_c0_g1_i1:183-1445(+)